MNNEIIIDCVNIMLWEMLYLFLWWKLNFGGNKLLWVIWIIVFDGLVI